MRTIQCRAYPTVILALVAFLAGWWPAASSFGAAAPLPSDITDAAFWRMVSDFSEPGGSFWSENFVSNELFFQFVIPTLKEITKPGGVYLGVGPEQNFTYLAALQPKIAFIIDIRRQNMLEHMMYKALFEMSSDRAEFLSRLFSRKRPPGLNAQSTAESLFDAYKRADSDDELLRRNLQAIKELLLKKHKFGLTTADQATIEHIYKAFYDAGPEIKYWRPSVLPMPTYPTYAELMVATDEQGENRSYLAGEENYRIVREMQEKNLIVPVVADFAGPKAVRTVAQYLKEHDARVTAFYISNVEQFLFGQSGDWERFYSNIAMLPVDPSSTFIRSVSARFYVHPNPVYGVQLQSMLSSMLELVNCFRDGRIRSHRDVIKCRGD